MSNAIQAIEALAVKAKEADENGNEEEKANFAKEAALLTSETFQKLFPHLPLPDSYGEALDQIEIYIK
jgi:hypothetical protein